MSLLAGSVVNLHEGINNKIKTLRRQGYGYPDDEYFFLKIIDASRREYVRNEASHRKSD